MPEAGFRRSAEQVMADRRELAQNAERLQAEADAARADAELAAARRVVQELEAVADARRTDLATKPAVASQGAGFRRTAEQIMADRRAAARDSIRAAELREAEANVRRAVKELEAARRVVAELEAVAETRRADLAAKRTAQLHDDATRAIQAARRAAIQRVLRGEASRTTARQEEAASVDSPATQPESEVEQPIITAVRHEAARPLQQYPTAGTKSEARRHSPGQASNLLSSWLALWLPTRTEPAIRQEVAIARAATKLAAKIWNEQGRPRSVLVQGIQSGRIRDWRQATYWQHRVICGGRVIGVAVHTNPDSADITRTPVYLLSDGSIAVGMNYQGTPDSTAIYRFKKWRRLPGMRASWRNGPLTFKGLRLLLRHFIGNAADGRYRHEQAYLDLVDGQ